MIITKIQRKRGKQSRYVIYIDESQSIELSDWTIAKCGLRIGDILNEEKITELKKIETENRAKNIAINYLSYRPRSAKEVFEHLVRKGFTTECAENTIKQLKSLNMIDDAKFAITFVRDKIKKKPVGPELLKHQLIGKGISRNVIDKVLAELISIEEQMTSASKAIRKKMKSLKCAGLEKDKQKRKLLDFLLRRGFSYDVALKVINSSLN